MTVYNDGWKGYNDGWGERDSKHLRKFDVFKSILFSCEF